MSCRCHVRYADDPYTGVRYCPRCHTPRTLSKRAELALRESETAREKARHDFEEGARAISNDPIELRPGLR